MNKLSELSNLEYHSDRTHLSSSALKLLLKDTPAFYEQYILNKRVESDGAHFAEGTLTHSLILEPEKVEQEYAIFNGFRRQGAAYDAFLAENPHKKVMTAAQMIRCQKLYDAYKASGTATALIQNGLAEHTLTSSILDTPVKCRADYIVPRKYIVDVKTTSAASDSELFKNTMHLYGYALSAALYAQIAYDNFNELHEFYFIVLSKQDFGCRVYRASSSTLSLGLADVMAAIVKYKKCVESGNWSNEQKAGLQLEMEEV